MLPLILVLPLPHFPPSATSASLPFPSLNSPTPAAAVRILALRCPCCLQWSEWHLPTAPLRPASVRRTSLCCAGTPRVGLTCRRDGGKEGGKIAMRPLRAQVSLLCCQGTSGRASERAQRQERREKREERDGRTGEREERGERESAPRNTQESLPPLPQQKERGRTARVATHRDGSAFSSRGVHRQPGPLQQHEPGRDGTGAGGPGCARDLGCGGGSTAGRAMGRGLRLGRRAQQLPPRLPLIRNEIRIIYILGLKDLIILIGREPHESW
jgi:hypothetical protein